MIVVLSHANAVTSWQGPYIALGWVLVTRKTNHIIKVLELWASTASREVRGGRVQCCGQ